MIIKPYSIKKLDYYFFGGCFILILLLGLISVISILWNWDKEIAVPTLAMFITPCVFIFWRRFRDNVFSVALIFFLIVYVYIPLTYVSILGENYVFGWGLSLGLPYSQTEYLDRYIPNLYFFCVCILSAFVGLSLVPTKFGLLTSEIKLRGFGIRPILLLGSIVLWILTADIITSLAAKAENQAGSEGLIKFLFFDHAYLLFAGVALFGINHRNLKVQATQARAILLIAGLFIAVGMLAGSKASWLGILYFFFFTSYSYLRNKREASILFPSASVGIFVIVMAPLLYLLTFFYRISLTTELEFSVATILSILEILDLTSLGYLSDEIFYRLSAGGFDRFMLIAATFVSGESSSYGLQEYLPYLVKNFANLMLPGTVYLEAYAPSSQLLPQVIQMLPMDGDVSAAYLLGSINSQAYTLFGVMTVLGGWLAPLYIFVYNLMFCVFYYFFKHLFIRMTLIYFYFASLSSFGFEIAAGYAAHVLICFFFMYFLLAGLSKFRIKPSQRGYGVQN